MPTARASREIGLPVQDLWELIDDPHHLPRWWPRVARVEDVEADAFTEVFGTRRGRLVRADFDVVSRDPDAHVLRWAQRIEGTPFERVLSSAETQVQLSALPELPGATRVTIELRHAMRGVFARLGGPLARRAATATLEEALDGLERIGG